MLILGNFPTHGLKMHEAAEGVGYDEKNITMTGKY